MAHPILSVKMYELDKKLERTHSVCRNYGYRKTASADSEPSPGMCRKQDHTGKQAALFQDRMCDKAGKCF